MKSYEEYYMEFMDSLFNRKKQKSDRESIKNGKESTIRKESNPIWAVILILISIPLIAAHIILLGPLLLGLVLHGLPSNIGLGFIGVILLLFPFSIIDFIVVFFYILTQKPHGIAKFISYTALTIVGLMLFYSGIGIMDIYF